MESRLGVDLANVRIHTDADAAAQAREFGARAFAYGSDIAFAPGEFAPETARGSDLLAHELGHVIDQAPGRERIQCQLESTNVGPDAEVNVHGQALPYLNQLQKAFGPKHDLSGVRAHTDSQAREAAARIGAAAYTMGEHVTFQDEPDLATAAHEAAHVVQQRAGVHLPDGVGQVGDRHEQNADEIARRLVRGQPIQELLPRPSLGGGPKVPRPALQRKPAAKRRYPGETAETENPRKILSTLRTYRSTPRVDELVRAMRREKSKYGSKIVEAGIEFTVTAVLRDFGGNMTFPPEEIAPNKVEISVVVIGDRAPGEYPQTAVARRLYHELHHVSRQIEKWLVYKGIKSDSPERQGITAERRLVFAQETANERDALSRTLFAVAEKLPGSQLGAESVQRALYWIAEEHAVSKTAARISGEVGTNGRPVDNLLIAEGYAGPFFEKAGGKYFIEQKSMLEPLVVSLKTFLDALERTSPTRGGRGQGPGARAQP